MIFKKLHRYTLEHYPLIWNMRLYSVLTIIAALHLFHFLVGYITYTNMLDMGWRSAEDMFFRTEFSIFSIIGSCLVLILWLIKVFRNNAFKHFYPISNGQLFAQFMILFAVCFFNMSYYFSYTYGYVVHARNNTNKQENVQDIQVFNRVTPLLQTDKESYYFKNKCYPLPFPIVLKYAADDNEVRYNPGLETNSEAYYYEGKDKKHYSQAQIDSILGGEEYAYPNLCHNYLRIYISGESEYYYADQEVYDRQTRNHATMLKQFLNQGPDKIRLEMKAFLKICDKYDVDYKLDVDDWVKWVYKPPFFPVKYLVYNQPYNIYDTRVAYPAPKDSSAYSFNPKGYFVSVGKLQYVLQNTQKAHAYRVELDVILAFLYISLGITLLLFTIRTATRRVWLITLIGSALIAMLVGAFTAIIGIGHRSGDGADILIFYTLVIFSFLFIHFLSKSKAVAGACLNWFAWSLPFMSLIILGFQSVARHSANYDVVEVGQKYTPPPRGWIEVHTDVYFLICLLVYWLILAFFLIPLYRKWQASPDN